MMFTKIVTIVWCLALMAILEIVVGQPTAMPSPVVVTLIPTSSPVETEVTDAPSKAPRTEPTKELEDVDPTPAPTDELTSPPIEPILSTEAPTAAPSTNTPTFFPTLSPSTTPPDALLVDPTLSEMPSFVPSEIPSFIPSDTIEPSPTLSDPATTSPSSYPSWLPTGFVSEMPSPTESTMNPSETPSGSMAPTVSPTEKVIPAIEVKDEFALTIGPVIAGMTEEQEAVLGVELEEFLGQLLGLLEQPFYDVTALVISSNRLEQRRKLQTATMLEVFIQVSGSVLPVEGRGETEDDFNLSRTCRNLINANEASLVNMLKTSAESAYFNTVTEVRGVVEPTDNASPPNPLGEEDTGNNGALTLGAILGIAIGGAMVLVIGVGFVYYRSRNGRSSTDVSSWGSAPGTASAAERENGLFERDHPEETRQRVLQERSQSKYELDSVVQSDLQSNLGTDTLGGYESMSYAYSLEHGIDTSVAHASVNSGPDSLKQAASAGIPMEIPNMDNPSYDTREVEMDYGSTVGDSTSAGVTKKNMIKRECYAPPGKLGIVIDTTVEGPVIHRVNPGSPLEGVVWPGDIIVAIDDIDTKAMSASSITALMAKNMDARRKLTILSDADA